LAKLVAAIHSLQWIQKIRQRYTAFNGSRRLLFLHLVNVGFVKVGPRVIAMVNRRPDASKTCLPLLSCHQSLSSDRNHRSADKKKIEVEGKKQTSLSRSSSASSAVICPIQQVATTYTFHMLGSSCNERQPNRIHTIAHIVYLAGRDSRRRLDCGWYLARQVQSLHILGEQSRLRVKSSKVTFV
jgi:hypothetical protein